MAQIIPGVDEYLRPGIAKLGETISLFTETDRRTQKAIRNMMLENPSLVQDFADLEFKSPGTLKKMGFGQMADSVAKLGPSMGVRREAEIGAQQLEVEAQDLQLKEIRNKMILDSLAADPTISAAQLGALVSAAFGIPRDAELEGEILDLIPKEMQAQRAMIMMQAAERGQDVEGSIYDYVRMFRNGTADLETIGAIVAHPLLAPQFERIDEMLQQRENFEQQKELADIRLSGQSRAGMKIPATLQNQIFELESAEPIIEQYEELLGKWFKLGRLARIGAFTGVGSKENQELAGMIQSLKQQLAGKLRLAVIGPGAVSDQERQMLLNSIGNATSFSALIRDPAFSMGQFEAMKQSVASVKQTLQAQAANFDTAGNVSEGVTLQFPAYLVDEMIRNGVSPDQIRAIVEGATSGGGTP